MSLFPCFNGIARSLFPKIPETLIIKKDRLYCKILSIHKLLYILMTISKYNNFSLGWQVKKPLNSKKLIIYGVDAVRKFLQ